MHIVRNISYTILLTCLIAVVLAPADVGAQEELEVNAQPYFQGQWTVGMNVDWGSVDDAEEYQLRYFWRDKQGKEFTPIGVSTTSARFEAVKNRGAPGECAYHWIRVKAQSDDGETIAEGTDNFCRTGFWIDNDEPAGLTGNRQEIADTLDFAQRVLRDMFEDLHINERN